MSLSKQLLILISLIFLIVFSVSFTLSMDNIRNYLEVESQVHVQDTATSLGLSMSPHMADEHDPILRTMMNAIFDMGYYHEMRLVNVDGEELVRLSNPVQMEGVPDWLIRLLPLRAATAVSEISSGWNIAGTLYVSSNPAYGYLKLYQQLKQTLLYSLLIFIAAFALLMLVLRFTLKPLKEIQKQAGQISSGNFVTIAPLPWTHEVRQVAESMNSMSRKIGDTISRLNTRLEALSDSLKRDPLTRLFNQATFNVDIKRALASGDKGFVFYLKFDDLAAITREHGNQQVDLLLQQFAGLLGDKTPGSSTAYRLYGSEFALLCPQCDLQSANALADQLRLAISALAQEHGFDDMMHMGIVAFDRASEFDRLNPALIEAYEQARNIGQNAYFIKQDTLSSMSEQDWKAAIQQVIEDNSPEITFTNDAYNYSTGGPVKVMEEAFTMVRGPSGEALPIGTFFSMAQEFGLAEALDKCIVNKVIQQMEVDGHDTPVTINLTMNAVSSLDFHAWLRARLDQTTLPRSLLVFSVTAYAAAKQIAAFAAFSSFVKTLGASTLLKRYSSDIIAIDLLRELHIDYIRLARDLTQNIRGNASKPDFLDIIQEVSSLLEIRVLAEAVVEDEDFDIVRQAGIFGISR